MKRRIYLTLERGRDIALRNLLRKVFIAGGFEPPKEDGAKPLRRTRVPVDEFVAAISLGSQQMLDPDEAECLLANMIYKVSLLCLCSSIGPTFIPRSSRVTGLSGLDVQIGCPSVWDMGMDTILLVKLAWYF